MLPIELVSHVARPLSPVDAAFMGNMLARPPKVVISRSSAVMIPLDQAAAVHAARPARLNFSSKRSCSARGRRSVQHLSMAVSAYAEH